MAVMLQGCKEHLMAVQAQADHTVAITSACSAAVHAAVNSTEKAFEADVRAYCDSLGGDEAKKDSCVQNALQGNVCDLSTFATWSAACVQATYATAMNATAIDGNVTAYISSSRDGYIEGLSNCFKGKLEELKAAQTSRLYDVTTTPQAGKNQFLFLAMTGFIIIMVVGSVAYGVKRFVQNQICDEDDETDKECGAME